MSLNPNICELAGTEIPEVLNNNEQSTSTNKKTHPDQENENGSSEVAIDEFDTNPIRHPDENRVLEKDDVELFSKAQRITCPDPLNMLTHNYEDQEPVTYFSGIVDHITKSKSYSSETCAEEFSTTFSDRKSEFSVTNLMTNETIEQIFDTVYETGCRGTIIENCDIKNFGRELPIHCASTEKEGLNSIRELNTRPTTFKSTLKRPSNDDANENGVSPYKKPKRGITFDSVSVYYFPRTQGFTCIPSQGGSTLGMSWNHSYIRKFSLSEYAVEQRRTHKQYCAQQVSRNWNEISNMSSDDSDSEEMISDSELDYENYNFLQPIPTRERRAMLRAAGVHKIDSGEKDECRSIRLSREFCGCDCQVYCNPETCICAQAGVKCQVDRMNFPCSCSRDGCANVNGRVEFNPIRVRTHYLHTLMRLEMEKKKEEEEEQRARLMLSGAEDLNPYSYSHSSPHNANTDLINFSYNDLNTYYHQHQQQSTQYVQSSSVAANSCFNFNFSSSNGEFILASTTYESMMSPADSSLILKDAATLSTMQYCSPILPQPTGGHPAAPHYDNNSSGVEQGLVMHKFTNSYSNENNIEEISYNVAESFVQVNKNYEQFCESRQDENVSTCARAEKEESSQNSEDTLENLGDIIKKTMVETIIA